MVTSGNILDMPIIKDIALCFIFETVLCGADIMKTRQF